MCVCGGWGSLRWRWDCTSSFQKISKKILEPKRLHGHREWRCSVCPKRLRGLLAEVPSRWSLKHRSNNEMVSHGRSREIEAPKAQRGYSTTRERYASRLPGAGSWCDRSLPSTHSYHRFPHCAPTESRTLQRQTMRGCEMRPPRCRGESASHSRVLIGVQDGPAFGTSTIPGVDSDDR
jgi:hypothetical protein